MKRSISTPWDQIAAQSGSSGQSSSSSLGTEPGKSTLLLGPVNVSVIANLGLELHHDGVVVTWLYLYLTIYFIQFTNIHQYDRCIC